MNEQIQTIRTWLGPGSINLFGCPFSGKDTQGRQLAEALDGHLIGGGDILRSHQDPAKITEVMSNGGLIPSDFYFDLVLPYLSQDRFKDKPLILDAVGRAAGEETTIMKAAADSGHPLKAVILITISEDEVWQRFDAAMKDDDRGPRADDNRGVLQNRLQKFRDRTMPVIDFYQQQGLLIEVNGEQSREVIASKIIEELAAFATR